MLVLLDRLLAPLARLLVARGVLFPAFVEAMKGHYIRAAQSRLEDEDQKQTDSRLSIMTGLQRRDVQRLKGADQPEPRPTPLARLVALWQTDPRFSSGDKPLILARSGPERSFDLLARDVRRDVHPRTLLDSLVDAGTVTVKDDQVRLITSSYQPLAGSDDQIAYLAANAGEHLMAAVENVLTTPKHFERALHYDRLTEDQIAELDAQFRKAQMDIMKTLSKKAAAMKKRETGTMRFRAGAYTYHSGDLAE